jgi:hypothetical protein
MNALPHPVASTGLIRQHSASKAVRARTWAVAMLAGLALLVGLPAAAQYKWKDQRGQLHVSDLPPPADVPERNILQRPGQRGPQRAAAPTDSAASAINTAANSSPAAAASKPVAPASTDPELARRRAQADAQARQQAEAAERRQANQRAQNCARARQQLALYDSGQRLQQVNAAGERVVVDDNAREAERQLARRLIASDCR